MERMKPNLDVFDEPRFAEWRRGDDVCGSIEGSSRAWCLFREIVDSFLGFFGFTGE